MKAKAVGECRFKRLPPFATLRDRLFNGEPLSNGVHIHCGYKAWERAQILIDGGATNVAHLVFPSDALPTEFDWSVVRDLEVTILHNPDNSSEAIDLLTLGVLAAECIRAGAPKVYRIDPEYPLKIYVPKVRRTAA